jgi:hypothetical protein
MAFIRVNFFGENIETNHNIGPQESLAERERQIDRLSQQIQELSSDAGQPGGRSLNKSSGQLDESQSEVMSTITISKAEEANRWIEKTNISGRKGLLNRSHICTAKERLF